MVEVIAESLAQSLKSVPFPISRSELITHFGNVSVDLQNGESMSLETALTLVAQTQFRSISDLALAIGEIQTGSGTHY